MKAPEFTLRGLFLWLGIVQAIVFKVLAGTGRVSRTSIASISAAAMLASALSSGSAMARTEIALPPATAWSLDASESGCALRRGFGPTDRPVVLEIRRYQPGDRFQLTVDGADLSSLVRSNTLAIEYGDLWKQTDARFQAGTAKRDDQPAVPSIFLSSALMKIEERKGKGKSEDDGEEPRDIVTPAMEEGVKQIALVWGDNRLVLETGSLGKPFAAMRTCTDALLEAWGLDPVVQGTLSRRANPFSRRAMASAIQAIYPATMAAQRKQGRVNFRALVNADGVVTQCDTMKSYNEPAFDAVACNIIQRTRFKPALDKDGKPVASYYAETVIYFIN